MSLVLQAVGAADAEGATPAAQPAREALKAVANPGSHHTSPLVNQHAQAPHHVSPVPAEPAPNRQGRRRTRHSADAELLGQTRGNASVTPAPAEPSHDGPDTARQRRSGGLAPVEHPLPVQQVGISASQDQEQSWREQRRWWQSRAGLRPAPLLWSHLLQVRAGRQARAGLISKTGRAGLRPAPLPSAHQVGPTSGLAASHYSVSQLTFAICDPTVSCSAPVHVCVYYPHHPMFAWSA